jgi:hypothetical protein
MPDQYCSPWIDTPQMDPQILGPIADALWHTNPDRSRPMYPGPWHLVVDGEIIDSTLTKNYAVVYLS